MIGFYKGVIADTRDPESRGRARLVIPMITGESLTAWAEPMFKGTYAVGDTVWCSVAGGDWTYPLFMPPVASTA